jgi:hypothetical protein
VGREGFVFGRVLDIELLEALSEGFPRVGAQFLAGKGEAENNRMPSYAVVTEPVSVYFCRVLSGTYVRTLEQVPSLMTFSSPESTLLWPRIWTPFNCVPFLELRSSSVIRDRDCRFRYRPKCQHSSPGKMRIVSTYTTTFWNVVDAECYVLSRDGRVCKSGLAGYALSA